MAYPDVAVLAVDGPGQAESLVLGYKVSVPNFIEAGKVIVDWAQQRPEIDPHRIGLFGNSFGSFTSTLIASNEPRLRACAVSATCLEPGFHSLLETASPTYKKRMMYMTGFDVEAEFDKFAPSLTWKGTHRTFGCLTFASLVKLKNLARFITPNGCFELLRDRSSLSSIRNHVMPSALCRPQISALIRRLFLPTG